MFFCFAHFVLRDTLGGCTPRPCRLPDSRCCDLGRQIFERFAQSQICLQPDGHCCDPRHSMVATAAFGRLSFSWVYPRNNPWRQQFWGERHTGVTPGQTPTRREVAMDTAKTIPDVPSGWIGPQAHRPLPPPLPRDHKSSCSSVPTQCRLAWEHG